MRSGLFVALFASCFLLGTVPTALAGQVVWHVLEDPAVAMSGPGADGLIGVPACPGTVDDDDNTTTENNKCNFSKQVNCSTGTLADPSYGSYSYGALEFVMPKSCLGGTSSGAACTTDEQCPGGECMDCPDNPAGFDSYYYAGNIGLPGGNGTMTLCQEVGASSYAFTSFNLGGSESSPGLGTTCINLKTPGGPYTGAPCGIGQSSSTVSVVTSILACMVPVGNVDNLVSTGRSYDVNDTNPTSVCGYSTADILCLLDRAKTLKGATYLLISCNDQTLPDPSTQTCLAGGQTTSVTVAWTKDDASDCVSECSAPGPCSGQ